MLLCKIHATAVAKASIDGLGCGKRLGLNDILPQAFVYRQHNSVQYKQFFAK
jgi:hypothetical protein